MVVLRWSGWSWDTYWRLTGTVVEFSSVGKSTRYEWRPKTQSNWKDCFFSLMFRIWWQIDALCFFVVRMQGDRGRRHWLEILLWEENASFPIKPQGLSLLVERHDYPYSIVFIMSLCPSENKSTNVSSQLKNSKNDPHCWWWHVHQQRGWMQHRAPCISVSIVIEVGPSFLDIETLRGFDGWDGIIVICFVTGMMKFQHIWGGSHNARVILFAICWEKGLAWMVVLSLFTWGFWWANRRIPLSLRDLILHQKYLGWIPSPETNRQPAPESLGAR